MNKYNGFAHLTPEQKIIHANDIKEIERAETTDELYGNDSYCYEKVDDYQLAHFILHQDSRPNKPTIEEQVKLIREWRKITGLYNAERKAKDKKDQT